MAYSLFFIFITLVSQSAALPDSVLDFLSNRENFVKSIATRATELHAHRSDLLKNCTCSKHSCSNDFLDTICSIDQGTPFGCTTEGRRLDRASSTINTPPGINLHNLSASIKESTCVYKNIEDLMTDSNNSFGWVYLATRNGQSRRYPGSASRRGEGEGNNLLNSCSSYDPRRRPWFVSTSTGPKDVVLVVDRDESMLDVVTLDGETKWAVTGRTVLDILDTFALTDFVNVVTFSNTTRALWKPSPLVRGTEVNLNILRTFFTVEKPGGRSNILDGLEAGFDLLIHDCDEESGCSNCQKVIIFLTGGKNSTDREESVTPSKVAKFIEKKQRQLEKKLKARAAIFAYTISNYSDDQIPRQIACQNGGAWSEINPHVNTFDVLNSYYLFIASSRAADRPIWIEPYTDAAGLGVITTVAMPFYAKGSAEVPDVFLGVVGHDVGLDELRMKGVKAGEVLDEIIDRSTSCALLQVSPCELQVYRTANDERSQCPDIIPEELESQCFAHKESYYRRFSELVDRATAASRCESEGGLLVSIEDKDELAFVSSLATADGCWIGLSRNKRAFQWTKASVPDLSPESEFWGAAEPVMDQGLDCVTIDNRGVVGNLASIDCKELRSYICVMDSSEGCNDVAGFPEKGYYSVPPVSSCSKHAIIDMARPIKEAYDLKSEDVICDFGYSRSDFEVICCDADSGSNYLNASKYVRLLMIIAGILLGVCVF